VTDRTRSVVEVTIEALAVHDRADEASYTTGMVGLGDRVRVRGAVEGGWLAIDPLATAFCWIERSTIELGEEGARAAGHVLDPGESSSKSPARAWVIADEAVIRSGHPLARLPGPPRGHLGRGTMVLLVDRPALAVGQGHAATLWYAIVPPPEVVCYIRAAGTDWTELPHAPAAETLAAYRADEHVHTAREKSPPTDLPPEIAAEIASVEAMHRAVITNLPIEQWRFDTVRARYQGLLKHSGDNPAVEAALRDRLARVTQYEQAARAARTIQKILAQSRRRDHQVAEVQRRLAAAERLRSRAYDAVGFMQASSRMVDGRKLFALIGANGSTLAYLDVPPGLDVQPLLDRRVGIRGAAHYNEDLGTRLISIRDMEALESRR